MITGLALTVVNGGNDASEIAKRAQDNPTDLVSGGGSDSQLMLGMGLSLCCVLMMAIVYAGDEWVQMQIPKPSDLKFCWMVRGVVCVCVNLLTRSSSDCLQIGIVQIWWIGIYMVLHTIPNWKTLVTAKMAEAQSPQPTWLILVLYLSLAFANGTHVYSFFWLLRNTQSGGVLIGVLQVHTMRHMDQ